MSTIGDRQMKRQLMNMLKPIDATALCELWRVGIHWPIAFPIRRVMIVACP